MKINVWIRLEVGSESVLKKKHLKKFSFKESYLVFEQAIVKEVLSSAVVTLHIFYPCQLTSRFGQFV